MKGVFREKKFCQLSMVVAIEEMERAARHTAAAEALLTSINGALQPDGRIRHDKTVAAARQALGETAFQSAWEAGQHLSMKETVELVLKEN